MKSREDLMIEMDAMKSELGEYKVWNHNLLAEVGRLTKEKGELSYYIELRISELKEGKYSSETQLR